VNERVVAVSRRFARVATRAVVARPTLWRLFRGPLRAQFDALAETWEARRTEASVAPVTAALERLPADPARILDLGTGTGIAARAAAARYPGARVVGVDLSPRMIKEARRLAPTELGERVRFEVADASALPFAPAEFDLVLLLNMIPFFSELARRHADLRPDADARARACARRVRHHRRGHRRQRNGRRRSQAVGRRRGLPLPAGVAGRSEGMARAGFEPATPRFSAVCSTN
jgi:SAM-dependent methyltransferase